MLGAQFGGAADLVQSGWQRCRVGSVSLVNWWLRHVLGARVVEANLHCHVDEHTSQHCACLGRGSSYRI